MQIKIKLFNRVKAIIKCSYMNGESSRRCILSLPREYSHPNPGIHPILDELLWLDESPTIDFYFHVFVGHVFADFLNRYLFSKMRGHYVI